MSYTKFHPKWHRTRIPIFWWVRKLPHVKFILRELTSVAVAIYAVILLLQIRALAQGPDAYASFAAWLRSPISVILHAILFAFVIFHSVTWFNLAPKALVLKVGKTKVPSLMIAVMNYLAWAALSITIAWFILRS